MVKLMTACTRATCNYTTFAHTIHTHYSENTHQIINPFTATANTRDGGALARVTKNVAYILRCDDIESLSCCG